MAFSKSRFFSQLFRPSHAGADHPETRESTAASTAQGLDDDTSHHYMALPDHVDRENRQTLVQLFDTA